MTNGNHKLQKCFLFLAFCCLHTQTFASNLWFEQDWVSERQIPPELDDPNVINEPLIWRRWEIRDGFIRAWQWGATRIEVTYTISGTRTDGFHIYFDDGVGGTVSRNESGFCFTLDELDMSPICFRPAAEHERPKHLLADWWTREDKSRYYSLRSDYRGCIEQSTEMLALPLAVGDEQCRSQHHHLSKISPTGHLDVFIELAQRKWRKSKERSEPQVPE